MCGCSAPGIQKSYSHSQPRFLDSLPILPCVLFFTPEPSLLPCNSRSPQIADWLKKGSLGDQEKQTFTLRALDRVRGTARGAADRLSSRLAKPVAPHLDDMPGAVCPFLSF